MKYARGSENGRADALSQKPDYMAEEHPTKHKIFEMTDLGVLVLQKLHIAIFQVCNTKKRSLD